MAKLIVTAAITGAIHVPSLSPYLPFTPDQIADDAIKASAAGAAVVHIHARDPENGKPSSDFNLYRQITAKIKANCDAAVCITTGGGLGMAMEERVRPITMLQPELASLNAGSINFAIYPLAAKLREPRFDWEIPYLEGTEDLVFSNTFRTLKYYAKAMYDAGTQPELEVYDAGMINNIKHLIDLGALRTPVYIQFVLGILGGIPASPENLVFLVETARRQLGEGNFTWSVCAAGRAQLPLMAVAMAMGGNTRVGLEDSLYTGPGQLAKSSAEQVTKVVNIARELSIPIATPDEARAILGLKGKDKVGF
ncbi:MAG: 3-keto-5-aminohexanoate cleavage protein [Negativicutes bacterium]|nr:3-keto-5-aminohexanoate cleavage protein [Negativicutes bacterium]